MNSQVMICDFGHARALDAYCKKDGDARMAIKKKLSFKIMTRWYRAPEVIVMDQYDFNVDIWSAGCVFAELLNFSKRL